MREYGGRVEIVGDPKDHSATDIIRRGWDRDAREHAIAHHPSDSTALLIVRLSAMGDIIHTLPAATALATGIS